MSELARLALIDDDPAWAAALGDYLRARGFEVETADDGRHGLELLTREAFDAAVLDWNMPGLTGPEVLAALRRGGHVVPVVLVSAEDEPERSRLALQAGAFAYLAKTASPRLLHQTLRQAVKAGARRAARPPALLPAPKEPAGC